MRPDSLAMNCRFGAEQAVRIGERGKKCCRTAGWASGDPMRHEEVVESVLFEIIRGKADDIVIYSIL